MIDLVICDTEKQGKHAVIDWDLVNGSYSVVQYAYKYEQLEGLDPSDLRVHFASTHVDEKLYEQLEALTKSRGFLLSNITVDHGVI